MRAYCTICSAGKRKDPNPLPAVERYTSPRIKQVYELSKQAGAFFFILSGQYGPLLPADEIPYYDHLLQADEVRGIGYKIAMFIEKHGITELILFLPPEEKGKDQSPLTPYRRAVEWAGIATSIIVIEETLSE